MACCSIHNQGPTVASTRVPTLRGAGTVERRHRHPRLAAGQLRDARHRAVCLPARPALPGALMLELELAPAKATTARPEVVAEVEANVYRQVALGTRLPANESPNKATPLTAPPSLVSAQGATVFANGYKRSEWRSKPPSLRFESVGVPHKMDPRARDGGPGRCGEEFGVAADKKDKAGNRTRGLEGEVGRRLTGRVRKCEFGFASAKSA
jgi:hypothetical protein